MEKIVNELNEIKIDGESNDLCNGSTSTAEKLVQLCSQITSNFLTAQSDEDRQSLSEQLVSCGLINVIIKTLHDDKIVVTLDDKRVLCEMIAELAKLEIWRIPLSDSNLFSSIVSILSSDDFGAIKQACRAIGNICYDNDTGRRSFTKVDGIKSMVTLMKTLIDSSSSPEDSSSSNGTDEVDGKEVKSNGSAGNDLKLDETLSLVTSCLFNVINTFDHGHDIALNAGLLPLLFKVLNSQRSHFLEFTGLSATLILQALTESQVGREHLMRPKNLTQLASLVAVKRDEEILTALLDVLNSLTEEDSARIHLTSHGLPEKLMYMLVGEDLSKSIEKLIMSLLNACLLEDSSMELLFDNGSGPLYKQCLKWIQNPTETPHHILTSAILMLGNFGRTDANCCQIVKDSGHLALFSILRNGNCDSEGDFQLQHGCLSTLRNLAIAAGNKETLSSPETLTMLLSMCTTVKAHPIVFKLLQSLRMLTDSQETVATSLGTNEDFLERLISWSRIDDHYGVKAEASRLLTWIVKNSKCRTVVDNLVRLDGLKGVIEMISVGGKVGIMQNEAFITLILMFASTSPQLEDRLIESSLGFHLHSFLTSLYNNPQNLRQTEILSNFITLLQLLASRSKILKDHLVNHKVQADLQNILLNGNPTINTRINQIINLLQ